MTIQPNKKYSDLRGGLEPLIAMNNKRQALCDNAPTCACGSKQVQLVSWIDNVEWRCRECKLTFGPKETNE